MSEWPSDDKAHRFTDLTDPIIDALKQAYTFKRKPLADIKWSGPKLGKSGGMQCSCLDNAEHLTKEQLAYDQDDQGRNAMEVIIGIAIRLGMEQGRRCLLERPRPNGGHQQS